MGDLTAAAAAHFTACHALMAEEIKAGMELFIEINQSPRRRGENNIVSSVIPGMQTAAWPQEVPRVRLVPYPGAGVRWDALQPRSCREQGREGKGYLVGQKGCPAPTLRSKGEKSSFATRPGARGGSAPPRGGDGGNLRLSEVEEWGGMRGSCGTNPTAFIRCYHLASARSTGQAGRTGVIRPFIPQIRRFTVD